MTTCHTRKYSGSLDIFYLAAHGIINKTTFALFYTPSRQHSPSAPHLTSSATPGPLLLAVNNRVPPGGFADSGYAEPMSKTVQVDLSDLMTLHDRATVHAGEKDTSGRWTITQPVVVLHPEHGPIRFLFEWGATEAQELDDNSMYGIDEDDASVECELVEQYTKEVVAYRPRQGSQP